MVFLKPKSDKGLEQAAKRYDFEVAKAPETAKVVEDQPQPLPQLDQLPVARQPVALVAPTRTIPYRRSR